MARSRPTMPVLLAARRRGRRGGAGTSVGLPYTLDANAGVVTSGLYGDGFPVDGSPIVSVSGPGITLTADQSQDSGDRPFFGEEPAFFQVRAATRSFVVAGPPCLLGRTAGAIALQVDPQTRNVAERRTLYEERNASGDGLRIVLEADTGLITWEYVDAGDSVSSSATLPDSIWGSVLCNVLVGGPTSADGGARAEFLLRPADPAHAQLALVPGLAVHPTGWAAASGRIELVTEVVRAAGGGANAGDVRFSSALETLTAPTAPELAAGVRLNHHGRRQGFAPITGEVEVTSAYDQTQRRPVTVILARSADGTITGHLRDRVATAALSDPDVVGDPTGAVMTLGAAAGSSLNSATLKVYQLGFTRGALTDAQRAWTQVQFGVFMSKRRSAGPDAYWPFATELPLVDQRLLGTSRFMWSFTDASDGSRPETLGYPASQAAFRTDLDHHPFTGHNSLQYPTGPYASAFLGDLTGESARTYDVHLLAVAPEQRLADLVVTGPTVVHYGKVASIDSRPASAETGWDVVDATDATLAKSDFEGGSGLVVRLADGDYGALAGSSWSIDLAGASANRRILVLGTGDNVNINQQINIPDGIADVRLCRLNVDDVGALGGAAILSSGSSQKKTGLKFWGIAMPNRTGNNALFQQNVEGPWFHASRCSFRLDHGYGALVDNLGPSAYLGFISDVTLWDDGMGGNFTHPMRSQRNGYLITSGWVDLGTDNQPAVGVAGRSATDPAIFTDIWTPTLGSYNYADNFGNVAPRQWTIERVAARSLRLQSQFGTAVRRVTTDLEGITGYEVADTQESRELFLDVRAVGCRTIDDAHEFEDFRSAPTSGPLINYASTLIDFGPPIAPAIAQAYRDATTGHVILLGAGPPRGGGYYVRLAIERKAVGSDAWETVPGQGEIHGFDQAPPAGAVDYRYKVESITKLGVVDGTAYSDPVRVGAVASLDDLMPALARFSPEDLVGGAASFGSGASLYVASSAPLQLGSGVDAWGSAWVYLTSKAADGRIMGKYEGSREFLLQYTQSADRFQLLTSSDGGTGTVVTTSASNLGSPALNTWYHLLWWHDGTTHTQNLRVDALTANSSARSGDIFDFNGPLAIGGTSAGTLNLGGRVDQVAYGKPAAGTIASVIAAIHATLYNSGDGAAYASLTPTQKTDWGLLGFWELDDVSWADAHASYDLTGVGVVGSARGIIETAFPIGGRVQTWTDAIRLLAPTQATAASRPTRAADGVDFAGAGFTMAVASNPLEDADAWTILARVTLDAYGGSGSTIAKAAGAGGEWSLGLTAAGLATITYDPDSGASATATSLGAAGTGTEAWLGARLDADGTMTAFTIAGGRVVHGAAVAPGAGRSIAGATFTLADGTLDGRLADLAMIGRAVPDPEILAAIAGEP